MAVDGAGNIYVATATNQLNGAIFVYQAGSYGNIAPVRTITGSDTGIDNPLGLAVDGSGNIYVANNANSTVTIYSSTANGNVAPTGGFFSTQIKDSAGVALDKLGNIYLVNQTGGSGGGYLVFPPGSSIVGNPTYSVSGTADHFSQTYGIAVH